MKNPFVALLAALSLLVSGCAIQSTVVDEAGYSRPIRLACVGDSITAGSGTKNRAVESYPAQLAVMLGGKWEVRNFGCSGATLLSAGNKPYIQQPEYKQALAFEPDVVVIKLGTNDAKPQNWAPHQAEFTRDYEGLIASFAALQSRPRIFLCRPIASFPPGNFTIQPAVIEKEIVPLIDALARKEKLPVVDLFDVIAGHGELVPDHVHPNAEGARLIAAAVYKALKGARPPRPDLGRQKATTTP